MKTKMQLEIARAKSISRHNELAALQTRSEEESNELEGLVKEVAELDKQLLELAEQNPPVQTRSTQFNELLTRASLGRLVNGFLADRQDGAERELLAECRMQENMIPLAMLEPPETRAVATIGGNIANMTSDSVLPIFRTGEHQFFNVAMPMVPAGQASVPVLTTPASVGGGFNASQAASITDGAFTIVSAEPDRFQAGFEFRRRDAARLPSLDSDLRNALSQSLSEKLDSELQKTLISGLTATDTSKNADYGSYVDLIFENVDGRFAQDSNDIKAIVGSSTFAHAGKQFQADSGQNAIQFLRSESGGLRVSPFVAGTASKKQNVFLRLGMRRDCATYTWDGIELIRDNVSSAAKGEIRIWGVLLAKTIITRAAGFKLYSWQIES